jgi:hypothetical protein
MEVSNKAFLASITALFYGMSPRVFAIEQPNTCYEILTGNVFLAAIYQFLSSNKSYPLTGELKQFQGMRFSELSVRDKRHFYKQTVDMTFLVSFRGNEGLDPAFRDMVKGIVEIS